MYRKATSNQFLLVTVYVDNLLVAGSCSKMISEFKQEMSVNFDMSDLGKLTYYLGMEVCQYENEIHLNQRRYASKILEDAEMIR